jgi:hypothetical protein
MKVLPFAYILRWSYQYISDIILYAFMHETDHEVYNVGPWRDQLNLDANNRTLFAPFLYPVREET